MTAQASLKKPILLTLGDAGGLGPELACRLLGGPEAPKSDRPVALIGPETALAWHADHLGLARFWTRLPDYDAVAEASAGVFLLEPQGLSATPRRVT